MERRASQTQARPLVVPEPISRERYTLSSQQRAVIDQLAIDYLKRNRLEYTRDNVRASVAVLGIDSLERGLLLSGREALGTTESVRGYVRMGLEHRGSIRAVVQEIVEETEHDARNQSSSLVGWPAIRRDRLSEAKRVDARFGLTPNIRVCDEIASQYGARKQMLPVLANLSISSLPKEAFPEVGIEQFPNLSDQAKMVRNMITRLAFYGQPIPILSVEELRELSSRPAEEIARRLAPSILDVIYPAVERATNLKREDLKTYLTDLLTQTRETFLHFAFPKPKDSSLSNVDSLIEERDRLFRTFAPTLLLLHPALEERPLITSPARAQESDYSLWGDNYSTVIDGKRVPNIDALFLARRLARAKQYDEARFRKAINAWRAFPRDQEEEAKRHLELKQEVVDLNREIQEVERGGRKPTFRIELLTRDWHGEETKGLFLARQAFDYNERAVATACELRSQAKDYTDKLRSEHSGQLPEKTEVPEWLVEQRVRRARAVSTAEGTRAHNQIFNADLLLHEEYFLRNDPKRFIKVDGWKKQPLSELAGEIGKLEGIYQDIKDGKTSASSYVETPVGFSEAEKYVNDYLSEVKLRAREHGMMGLPISKLPGDRDRIDDLTRLRIALLQERWRAEGRTMPEEAPKDFYLFTIRQRLFALNHLLASRKRLEFEETPQVSSSQWSREEIIAWEKRIMVETFPFDEYSQEELQERLTHLQDFMSGFRRLTTSRIGVGWPKAIPSKEQFVAWIDTRVREIEEHAKQPPPKAWTRRMQFERKVASDEKRVGFLFSLKRVIDDPLFPLPEGEGLPSQVFFEQFGRRLRLMRAVLQIDWAKKEFEDAQTAYDVLKKEVHLKYLSGKRDEAQEEVVHIEKDHPAVAKFLKTMQELNLVVEEETRDAKT